MYVESSWVINLYPSDFAAQPCLLVNSVLSLLLVEILELGT